MMSISGIYALTSQTTEGVFSTGTVDIEIETYTLNNENQEKKYDEVEKKVMPGEIISFVPKINNIGESCYLRLKINYVDESTDFKDYVTGFSEKFKMYGEYYYYDGIVNQNENIKLFDTIKIPEKITQDFNNGKIKLEIIAEAIQDKNFEPDYTLTDPWKNITPTECIKSYYDVTTENDDSKISIRYEDETNKDISVSDNFFDKLKKSMPGDSVTSNVQIKNNNKLNTKYYLRFDLKQDQTKEIELLKQVKLTITNKSGQVVYKGNLISENPILLGEYSVNQYDNLEIKISIPAELGNEYANLNPEISLIFSEEHNEESSNKGIKENSKTNPKTGDSIDLAMTVFFISSIGLITVMFLAYKRRK